MDAIDSLEASKLLKEGNPSKTALKDFYTELLADHADDLGLQAYYCERVVRKFFYGTPSQNRTEDLKGNLSEIEDDQSQENETRTLAHLTIGLWYIESSNYYSVDGVLSDWKEIYEINSLYYYLSSRRLMNEKDQDSINRAIEDAYEANDGSTSEYFRYNLASVLLGSCLIGFTYTGEDTNLPKKRDVMLELASDMIETVLNKYLDDPEFYLTKAEVSLLRCEWNEVQSAINQGLETMRSVRDDNTHFYLEFRLMEYRLSSRKERFESKEILESLKLETSGLEEQVEELSQNVSDESERISNIDEELEQNRVRFLQFLGFFAGLLAVAVTSTQIIATVTAFETGFRLILSLTGAILVSFGGFSTMLTSTERPASFIPPVLMTVLGFVLLGLTALTV